MINEARLKTNTFLSFLEIGDPRGIFLNLSNGPGKKLQISFFILSTSFSIFTPNEYIIECSAVASKNYER